MVQWLRLCTSTAGGTSEELRSCMPHCRVKKKRKEKKRLFDVEILK